MGCGCRGQSACRPRAACYRDAGSEALPLQCIGTGKWQNTSTCQGSRVHFVVIIVSELFAASED